MAKNLKGGTDASIEYFLNLQVWGTPEMCFDKIDDIRKRVNANHFTGVFSYAGMPWEDAEKNLTLFAKEVMPGAEEAQRRPGEAVELRARGDRNVPLRERRAYRRSRIGGRFAQCVMQIG